jgi:hypothetical protein
MQKEVSGLIQESSFTCLLSDSTKTSTQKQDDMPLSAMQLWNLHAVILKCCRIVTMHAVNKVIRQSFSCPKCPLEMVKSTSLFSNFADHAILLGLNSTRRYNMDCENGGEEYQLRRANLERWPDCDRMVFTMARTVFYCNNDRAMTTR